MSNIEASIEMWKKLEWILSIGTPYIASFVGNLSVRNTKYIARKGPAPVVSYWPTISNYAIAVGFEIAFRASIYLVYVLSGASKARLDRVAETRISDLIYQNACQALELKGYGKNFITNHGFSPDAFVLMAFQAAYFRLYSRIMCIYEPAMTKAVLYVRTEAIRSIQPESGFHEDLLFRSYSITESLNTQESLLETHQADKGMTPPRGSSNQDACHLYRSKIRNTEHLHSQHIELRFGPVAADGYGIGYIIKEDGISVCASSKHLQTRRFLGTLQDYLSANERPVPFVDHLGILRDTKTGRPIHGYMSDSGGEDEEIPMPGYLFFNSGEVKLFGRKKKLPYSDIGQVIPLAEY
ncbi:hypothetical protein BDQ12DRAFT_670959 [Crucibulum laeve]|uniref:Choline/carnitine acyltransferase domain-containing protein n=1 Tax=Crucibulum laeve TaxID=68775 RepID=A0A5C3LIJ5_9AGAR|nr:hypothetical protein BDQ12DRAFT_670959 [Crucibulum laeve]